MESQEGYAGTGNMRGKMGEIIQITDHDVITDLLRLSSHEKDDDGEEITVTEMVRRLIQSWDFEHS